MDFTDKGKKAFQSVTRAIAIRGQDNALPSQNPLDASQHFAIVLDNELVSTPYINYRENPDGIDGQTGAQISGGFTLQSAQDLAKFLKIGALPIRLDLISRSQVSASLGKQALSQGLTAGIAGFLIVAFFLIIFYRILGLIAVSALAVYALYFYALVKLIPVVLSLPGIAGLILTIGVAADANIVIFERVKEEIRRGRSTGSAIAEGYKKGFSTIVDANVVTLLVAFILFILATAGVRGFALTLGIGTIVSLFTAVLATQAILLSLRGTSLLRSKAALGAGSTRDRWHLDFMGASKWFFSMSGLILLIGALAIAGKGLKFGIDFESGTRIKASLQQAGDGRQRALDGREPRLQERRGADPQGRAAGQERRADLDLVAAPAAGRPRRERAAREVRAAAVLVGLDRPDVRPVDRQLRADRDHRVAGGDLALHRAPVPVEVRRPGADRVDARRADHGGRLRPRRPGGDGVDGRGVADHPRFLALRHDHRVRPHPGEHAAHAQRRVLADREPVDVRGADPVAGDVVLDAAAGARAVPVRR